jgi:hypothetical protein
MKLVILFVCALTYSTSSAFEIGQVKGYEKLSREISSRLFALDDSFQITYSVGFDSALSRFLGGYTSYQSQTTFINPYPSPNGITLYHLVLNQFATDLAQECQLQTGIIGGAALHPDFRIFLNQFCQWPDPELSTPEKLNELWVTFVGYNTQPEEELAWLEFISTQTPDRLSLSQLILSTLLNPAFILEN